MCGTVVVISSGGLWCRPAGQMAGREVSVATGCRGRSPPPSPNVIAVDGVGGRRRRATNAAGSNIEVIRSAHPRVRNATVTTVLLQVAGSALPRRFGSRRVRERRLASRVMPEPVHEQVRPGRGRQPLIRDGSCSQCAWRSSPSLPSGSALGREPFRRSPSRISSRTWSSRVQPALLCAVSRTLYRGS